MKINQWIIALLVILCLFMPACDDGEVGFIPEFCWNQKEEGTYHLHLTAEQPAVINGRGTMVTVTVNALGKISHAEGRVYVASNDTLPLNIPVVYCQLSQTQSWSQQGSCFELRTFCADCNAGELLRVCLGTEIGDTTCTEGFWSKTIASDACDHINFYGEGFFTLEQVE